MSGAPRDPGTPRHDRVGWLERRINLTEIFSFLTHFGLVYTPVDTTKPLREALREVASQPVSVYTRGPNVLGLLAAILFGIQVVTGVLLAYYYRPAPEAAFESTRMIVRDLPAGWFMHQMHAWGSWLLVAVLLVRLLRLFWDGLYRAPREITWWGAVALAVLALQFDFTGRVLTWDSHAYWGTVRGMEVLYATPLVGPVLALVLGGRAEHEYFLTRFYVLHIIVLPAFYLAFFYLTFSSLRRVGLRLAARDESGVTTTYRHHIYNMAMLTVLLFAALVTLATLLPFRFLSAADPYHTPPGVKPPWYLAAPYFFMQYLPVPYWLTGFVLLVAAAAIFLLPLWIRGEETPAGRRRIRLAGIVVVGLWAALTLTGLFVEGRVTP